MPKFSCELVSVLKFDIFKMLAHLCNVTHRLFIYRCGIIFTIVPLRSVPKISLKVSKLLMESGCDSTFQANDNLNDIFSHQHTMHEI